MSGPPGAVELEFSPRPPFVLAVRHVVAALARMQGFPPGSVEDVRLAVSEAVTNAITRQSAVGSDEPVRLTAEPQGQVLAVEVTDRGAPFDPGTQGQLEPSSDEFSFEHGLSLEVVQGIADRLELLSAEDTGMVVRFTVEAEEAT